MTRQLLPIWLLTAIYVPWTSSTYVLKMLSFLRGAMLLRSRFDWASQIEASLRRQGGAKAFALTRPLSRNW